MCVLYASQTLTEMRDWVFEATGGGTKGSVDRTGAVTLIVLAALTILSVTMARWLSSRAERAEPLSKVQAATILTAPLPPAVLVGWALRDVPLGPEGFFGLTAFLAVWGGLQIVLLWGSAQRIFCIDPVASALFLSTSLMFALALDRYGAAFLPSGPRVGVMALLCLGAVPFAIADRVLADRLGPAARLGSRAVPILGLLILMIAAPFPFGLHFTTVPVLILFWLAFGSMAYAFGRVRGHAGLGPALGIFLAWSIAASTPIFDAAL